MFPEHGIEILIHNNVGALGGGLLLGLVFYMIFFWEDRVTRLLRKFPGDVALPFVGHAWKLVNPDNNLNQILLWHKTYGPRCRMYFCSAKCISLCDAEDIELVLKATDKTRRRTFHRFIKMWIGESGFITNDPAKWRSRRKLIAPAFFYKMIEDFQTIFNEKSRILLSIIRDKTENDQECELVQLFSRLMLDTICETSMSKKMNTQMDTCNEYLAATVREVTFVWKRWTTPWLHNDFIWNLSPIARAERANRAIMKSYTQKIIKERKEYLRNNPELLDQRQDDAKEEDNLYCHQKRQLNFLDLLLQTQAENPDFISDNELLAEAETLMFVGQETTQIALAHMLYLLGHHPEHQEKIIKEIDSVFGNDRERTVTFSDLNKLEYMKLCIKESLRVIPNVSGITREVVEDIKLDSKLVIPKGANVILNIWAAHRSPRFFPNPSEFIPERFSAENSVERHPYAYLPFGIGPRSCIGQQYAISGMRTTLVYIFRHFRVTSLDSQAEIKFVPGVVISPKNGIRVKFTPRV